MRRTGHQAVNGLAGAKGPHPDAIVFDHREMALPVGTARDNTLDCGGDFLGGRDSNAQKNDAGHFNATAFDHQLTEVLIKGEDDPVFLDSPLDDGEVGCS